MQAFFMNIYVLPTFTPYTDGWQLTEHTRILYLTNTVIMQTFHLPVLTTVVCLSWFDVLTAEMSVFLPRSTVIVQ